MSLACFRCLDMRKRIQKGKKARHRALPQGKATEGILTH